MARATFETLLPLDRWARHLGIEPRHFNQVVSAHAPAAGCAGVWLQHAWQANDKVGREEVAVAIQEAEAEVMPVLGFSPVPQWAAGEVVRTTQHYNRSVLGCSNLETPDGRHKSVQAKHGHIISGGVRAVDLEGDGAAIVWVDATGAPCANDVRCIARVQVATAATDENEIRVYFPGETGDEWEIRPLSSVTIAAGVATILIDRHLLVDPDLWEALAPEEVDGDVDGNFVATVDVYRVYNDPSQQAQLQWERLPSACSCGSTDCAMCAWATQWACLQTRDPRLGIVTYQPGEWDATEGSYSLAQLSVSRQPERVRLWYRHGWQSDKMARPMVEMEPELERIIVLLSICLLDRPICGCSNVEAFYERWTEDRALVGEARYQLSARDLDNPWGTRTGQIRAWKMAQRLALGRSVRY